MRVALRILLRIDGALAADPMPIEASASRDGPQVMQAAMRWGSAGPSASFRSFLPRAPQRMEGARRELQPARDVGRVKLTPFAYRLAAVRPRALLPAAVLRPRAAGARAVRCAAPLPAPRERPGVPREMPSRCALPRMAISVRPIFWLMTLVGVLAFASCLSMRRSAAVHGLRLFALDFGLALLGTALVTADPVRFGAVLPRAAFAIASCLS
ncbi:MAG: hypothetical protein IRZ09_13310 [Variibacter sp.]|nr:hypothetical protein [Variibacter sp.]